MGHRTDKNWLTGRAINVRFGSKADVCVAKQHVRFAANSDRESGLPQKVMSALRPTADMCAATTDVGYGPIAAFTSAEECRGRGATFDAGRRESFNAPPTVSSQPFR